MTLEPPDSALLAEGLSLMLASEVTLVAREPNIYQTTFASEFVTYERGDGRCERVFCKYGPAIADALHTAHGARGGVPYEAAVYAEVLRDFGPGTPRLRGVWSPDDGKTTWLVLEALDHALRVTKVEGGVAAAAAWAGRFHASTAATPPVTQPGLLREHDDGYLRGWIDRTRRGATSPDLSWFPTVCGWAHDLVDVLLSAPVTVVHGEYFPHNVLCDAEGVHPIDWESCAIGIGEIDLATIVEGWNDATVIEDAVRAYRDARWPDGAPTDFPDRMLAARVHTQFRWLGDLADWSTTDESRGNLEELHRLAIEAKVL
jgi:hypothetical protein